MKSDHERVTKLLSDTVTLLCKNGLSYDHDLRVQGLLGITIDSSEVFLVSINDCFNCSSSSSPASVPSSFTDLDAAGTSQSRKRALDDTVDLTRLVETPQVHTDVQPSQLPSSIGISPLHHRAQTRPRSVGSVGQARSLAVTPSSLNLSMTHSQPLARQPPLHTVMPTGHPNTYSVHRNSAEHFMPANNQHDNASTLVDPSVIHPGQRPHAGYMDSIHNLALSCDRHFAPRWCQPVQQHRQLPLVGASDWTSSEHLQSRQLQLMCQNMATGAASAAAAGNSEAVGRANAEHFGFSPHAARQTVPRNVCAPRSEVNSSHYVYANTAVPGAVGPPSMLSRQPCPDVIRPVYHDRLHYVHNMPQSYAASAQGRQSVDSAAMQPPAKRHAAPNYLPRQAVQSFNPTFMQNRLSRPQGYLTHSDLASVSQQAHSVADPHAQSSLLLTSTSTSPASCVTFNPVVKPPSSPDQSGRRLRPRQVEHIDLCDDDDDNETTNSGIHIPVSSVVIQPENVDVLTATDEAERSSLVSMDSVSEFEAAVENSFSGTGLAPLTRIVEIVPLDDGHGLEDISTVRTTVAAESVRQSVSASASVEVVISEASDSGSASNHRDLQPSAALLDVSKDRLSMFADTFNESQLSADEIAHMAELCFDADDNAEM